MKQRFPMVLPRWVGSALIAISATWVAPGCKPWRGTQGAAGSTAATPTLAFEKLTLPNGLRVILHVDRKLPMVHVNQWFHVGSKNERPGRTGFAHLFEHMMFQGSRNAPGEYFTYAERAGANLRAQGVNGTTNKDRTNYFATVPSGSLEFLLWLESDRLATLMDTLEKKTLDNQRNVVKNERRQGVENRPYGRFRILLSEHLYPRGHPYSWSAIGSHEDLTAASLEDVKAFFRRYYTPNNLSLAITGDFDPQLAKRLVRKYYGSLPPGPALARPARWVPSLAREKVVEVSDHVRQARTYLAWPSPPYFDRDEAALDLAVTILTDGLSSRLQKLLVYDKQLCTSVRAYNASKEIAGEFVVFATARPGASLRAIEALIDTEIARLARSGPTAREMQRTKSKYEYGFMQGLERIGGFGGKADQLNRYNVFLGDPGKLGEDIARYRAVTRENVRKAVARWLATDRRLVVRFRPERSRSAKGPALDRSKAPALGKDLDFTPPTVKTAQLPNGMKIFVVSRPNLPMVSVTLAVRAGSRYDPAGKAGLARLTLRTIDMGTKHRRALQIENDLGTLGTRLVGRLDREYATLSLGVLKRYLRPATDILARVAQNASFPPKEVARERKRHLFGLARASRNPRALAARLAPMLVYGRDHPYGSPVSGLPSTVRRIRRDDLARFHRSHWTAGGAALVLVGDVGLAEAVAQATRAFGGWGGDTPKAPAVPAPRPVAPGGVFLVHLPQASQTLVVQAMPGPARKTPDYYALRLADAVWGGGGFGTRLNLNLRENKGYSYGVFSQLALYPASGSWYAAGGVQRDKTIESIREFVKELTDISGQRPVSAKELAAAKAVSIRGYAQNFEASGGVGRQVARLWAHGLPLTELAGTPIRLAKTPLDAVNAAARKYAVPEKATLLLIGDLERIETQVRALGLGQVQVLDAEGRPRK